MINQPLTPARCNDTMPPTLFDIKAYAEMQLLVLTTQINYWRKQLGMNPKRCPHCGGDLK
jgi:hypothetical protein